MRVLVDMNLSPAWATFLRGAGIESVHWTELGRPDASDEELMRWAEREGYILMTADLDFAAILAATGRNGPSVLQIRADLLTPAALGQGILDVLSRVQADMDAGAVVSFDGQRMRVRVLPLH
jgi:predicted nuclease of predicted toxin-antitoxin system